MPELPQTRKLNHEKFFLKKKIQIKFLLISFSSWQFDHEGSPHSIFLCHRKGLCKQLRTNRSEAKPHADAKQHSPM